MNKALSPTLRYTFLLHSSQLGGAERSALELAKGLIKNGNLITCLVPEGPNELSEMLETAGAKVERLKSIKWWTDQPITAIETSQELETLLKNIKSDLVVTITGVIPQAAIAARNLGIPHIWFLHEFIEKDHGMNIPFNQDVFSRFVLEYSEKVICNSRSVQKYFFPESPEKVTFLYPFPENLEAKQIHKHKDHSAPLNLGIVANFSQGKGHLLLLSALLILRNSNFNARVKFFGHFESTQLFDELNTYIKINELEKYVFFEGFVASREEVFRSIDAVVVPSLNEAFGRVPFEAMSYAVPVIYSNSGALVEYMVPDKNGIPFEANDPVSLANAIRKLADRNFNLSGLVLGARAFVENIQDTNSYISDVVNISNSVVLNFKKLPLKNSSNILIDEFLSVTRQRDELTRQRDELTRQRDELTRQRDELSNSTIWKITKPLRTLINLFRKIP